MSRIFIDRPIFAWVVAIIFMMIGIGSITQLPIAQYPDVAPPQVSIRATYPGASAQTLQDSVTQVLEQQLTGLDGLLYFQSSSSSRGQVTINVTFAKGTDPDIAQVQVQNAIQPAYSRLPQQVQQQGVQVVKASTDFLLIVGLYDENDKYTDMDIADWLSSNMEDPLARITGVGDVNVFGSPYAMRIWLDPAKLRSFSLIPGDIVNAIAAQNVEVAAGEVGGQPSPPGQLLNATVTAQSRLQSPEEFRNIIVKAERSGARVLLSDVARVELGAENYNVDRRVNGHPGAGIAVFLAPGADALETADLVKSRVEQLAKNYPPGFRHTFAYDTTDFIKLSVEEVLKTLVEAMILVIFVMFVFLQSWRATLVPAVAIPVVLLGTFGVLYALDFSINTMTLFGLVLAIGLLVDDAIVVVENVERLMEENPHLTPREATIESMDQIQMALVAIALVLSAVFLPMVFFGGSTGVIYRQFSATIVSAMVLSVFVAMTLSPALAAQVLKPKQKDAESDRRLIDRYGRVVEQVLRERDRFNSGLQAADRMVCEVGWLCRQSQMALPCRLCRRLRCPGADVFPPAHRFPSDRGPGRRPGPVPAPCGCHARADAGGAANGRELPDARARQGQFRILFHRRRRRTGGRRTEHRPGVHQSVRLRSAQGQRKFRRRHHPARTLCFYGSPRRAGFRPDPARHPRPRPVGRVQHAAAKHKRHEPEAV